jgi:very-short-patch-repair endonuclease
MGSKNIDISSAVTRVLASLQNDFEFMIHEEAVHLVPLVESEIELMLLTTMAVANRLCPMKFVIGDVEVEKPNIAVMPQYEWNGYRIDFCLRAPWRSKMVFIECDGHDFHERTKEQAERDRSKDRAIQAAGIPILRFTGREIWRDTSQVMVEIINFLYRNHEGSNGKNS